MTLAVGPLQLDPISCEVTLDGRAVELASAELKLLRFFMAHPDRVFSRAQVRDQVWGDHVFSEERTGDVHIRIEADLEVFSQAAEASPDGLVILDGDDRIVWCNRKAERHLGLNAARDIGIGIAAEHLPRLTERYYRIGRGRSRETGGIGLGLAIVKHILMCHQARLEIRSEAGAGSTFSAVFPVWRTTLPGGTVV